MQEKQLEKNHPDTHNFLTYFWHIASYTHLDQTLAFSETTAPDSRASLEPGNELLRLRDFRWQLKPTTLPISSSQQALMLIWMEELPVSTDKKKRKAKVAQSFLLLKKIQKSGYIFSIGFY